MAEGTTIGQLIVEIGSQIIGGSQLKDFIKTLGEGSVTAYAQAGAIEQVAVRMRELAEVVMQAAASYEMFESTTGLSAMDLQKWTGMAKQANVSADTMAQSVQSLSQHLANVRWTGQGIKPFQIMGISPQGDPFDVMKRMINWSRTQKDKAFAGNLFEEAGMSRQLLQLGRLSDSELANFVKHAAIMTSAQQNTFNRLTLGLAQMHEALMKMGYILMEYVLPPVTHVVNMLNALLDLTLRYKTEIATVGATLAIAFVAVNPALALMIGAFGLLFITLDDLAVYFEGGDSLIGRAIKGLKTMPAALSGVKAFFEGMKLWFEALTNPAHLLITLFEKLENLAAKGNWLAKFENTVKDLKDIIRKLPSEGIGLTHAFAGAASQSAVAEAVMPSQPGPGVFDRLASMIHESTFPMGRMAFPQGSPTANSFDVDINVQSAGPLDAPGWGDVAHVVKKAVMDAAMQTHR